jgi:hypothetical protein
MCFEEWKDNLVSCTGPTGEPPAAHMSPDIDINHNSPVGSFSTYVEKAI